MSNGVQSCSGGLQLSNDVKENDNGDVDLVEDFDSYWQDINYLLTVSRVVSDTVIKGMVQEAAEKIADKELEVTKLKEMLHVYHVGVENEFLESLAMRQESNRLVKQGTKDKIHPSSLEPILEHDRVEQSLSSLRGATKEQFKKLEAEIDSIRGSSVKIISEWLGLRDILQDKVSDRWIGVDRTLNCLKSAIESGFQQVEQMVRLSKADVREWHGRMKERISGLHQELDAISKSLSVSDFGQLSSHGSLEGDEESNNFKEGDSTHWKVLNYLKSSSPSPATSSSSYPSPATSSSSTSSSYPSPATSSSSSSSSWEENDTHHLVGKNKELATFCIDEESLSSLKDRLESLLSENHQLKDLLTGKEWEVKCLSLQVSEAAEKMSEHNGEIEHLNMESFIMQELVVIIFREALKDAEQKLNNLNTIYTIEIGFRVLLQMENLEKRKQLEVEIANRENLKQEILFLVKAKERLEQDAAAALEKEKERYELAAQELENLRGESNAAHRNLVERHTADICKLQQMFLDVNQEKQNAVSLFEAKERELKQQLKSITVYSCGLLRAITDFQCRVTQDISGKSSRLKSLSSQLHSLKQKANVLVKRNILCKQGFERKCSELEKAEAEVDLLGEEVDSLSSLVEKIYMALDHYSPILQHYAGISEILKLIRGKLRGETKAV
ncbi:hypothetical protein Pyn_25709 [Prunus yedoensis var. nudiflora]|uniref:WPP domain-associated protein n=1 Tax=Prunus yedoensis var. nudiflora TaxID=2094558 RepID=A0A314YZ37_PRUYE|nr:hypothetical protein Pyn_25709 [Prunus yedoensis var. nudiflora]